MPRVEQWNPAKKLDSPGNKQHSQRVLPTRMKNIGEKNVWKTGTK